jgi:hypothetical protein
MFQTPLHACGTDILDVGVILQINSSSLGYKYPISTWMSEIISPRDPIEIDKIVTRKGGFEL